MALRLRSMGDNVRTDVLNEIQATSRNRIPPATASPQDSKADHPVRRHGLDSAQAAAIGISLCKGFCIIYPRYRGAWESGGQFLEKSPHEDILDSIDDLPKGMEEIASSRRFRYRRIESSSSEEASVVQRRFCCRLIREPGGSS
jgi:hypothetical protein